jgi:hypothetical protein
MGKSPRSVADEKSCERAVALIDFLKEQLLDLKALRQKVAEAEIRSKVREGS